MAYAFNLVIVVRLGIIAEIETFKTESVSACIAWGPTQLPCVAAASRQQVRQRLTTPHSQSL